MPSGLHDTLTPSLLVVLSFSISDTTLFVQARAAAAQSSSSDQVKRGDNNPLGIDWNPAPSPEDGPAGARYALRNPAYLPAQIGGIVGSYAFSLVLVALILLALAKKRRRHLQAAEDLDLWEEVQDFQFDFRGIDPRFQSQGGIFPEDPYNQLQVPQELPKTPGLAYGGDGNGHPHGHVRNFSLPSPTSPRFDIPKLEVPEEAVSPSSYFVPSPTSTTRTLGQDPYVDQGVVHRDRAMAQSQLEEMYKYVMEQEEAKEAGVEFRGPVLSSPIQQQLQQPRRDSSSSHKKERNKPANLNLNKTEKTSRTSSILSALKSPLGKKKPQVQGITISSPMMTPMSGTFPQYSMGEEMNSIPPRQYAPAKPPPVPTDRLPFSERRNTGHIAPLTPPDDQSPESTQSIDERLGAMGNSKGKDRDIQRGEDISEEEDEQVQDHDYRPSNTHAAPYPHSRNISLATTEADPVSAISESSQSPLVRNPAGLAGAHRTSGLPTSPKPGVTRFPSLPSSPKPGATFSRPNAPSAVRTGGALPLRAYETNTAQSGLMSPTSYNRTVKQTVFERAPMSPGGMHTARTPLTGNPVPYSPYQPFSPVVPITPSLVTKADRKRMRKMEPKTPTLAMVKSDDELW